MRIVQELSILALYGLIVGILSLLVRLEWAMFYALVPLALGIYFSKSAEKLFYALSPASLFALAFPDLDYSPLIFLFLVPLMILTQKEKSFRWLFFYGTLNGILTLFVAENWVYSTIRVFGGLTPIASIPIFFLFCWVFSLKFPVLLMGLSWVQKKLSFRRIWTFPLVIALSDYLVYQLFPWYLGNSQYKNLYFIQIVELTGMAGLSYLIALLNTLFFEMYLYFKNYFRHSFKESPIRKKSGNSIQSTFPKHETLWVMVIFVLVYLFGFWRVWYIQKNMDQNSRKTIKVGMVQPNTPLTQKTRDYEKIFATLSELSRKILEENLEEKLDLLVWPESAAPFSYKWNKESKFRKLLNKLSEKYSTPIFFGNLDRDNFQGFYNSSRLLTPDLKISQPYHKIYLLPFGEYIPLGETLPKLYAIFRNVGRFERGKKIEILDHPKIKIAPQICYEIIIPSFTRQFIQKGAEIIVNITNDRWFGISKASKQHLVLALFRSIENRVPIVRSTNSGVSAFIDPIGRIVSEETPLYQTATLVHTLKLSSVKGIYSMIGDSFLFLLLIQASLFIWIQNFLPFKLSNKKTIQ